MSGILDLLTSDLGKTIISGVAGSTGQDASKTSSILTMAMPLLTQAMAKNASSPEGAQGLMSALSGKHDGSILDNLGGLFSGGVDSSVTDDGGKILGHILGGKQENIQNALSQQSGVDSGAVGQILKVAAPLLMGIVGKQSQQQNIASPAALTGLLGGMMNNSKASEQNFLTSLLDADGDGSIIDDVAGMVLGGNKKKGGIGGLLGGLFGKK